MTPSLKIKFPFPEYNMVWEAEQYFLYGKGPLQEHGALKIRWGTVSHGEPQLREELAAWFKSNGTLTEENVDECLGIIDKYLQKEKNKQDAEDDARGDLKESSLKEQMVFLSSMGSITPQRVRSFGLDPSIIRKAQIAKIIETTPNGTMRGNHYRGRLMEDDLEPGQSVYRIKDGKVQKVVVTSAESGKATVAGTEAGTEVDEEDPVVLGTSDPNDPESPITEANQNARVGKLPRFDVVFYDTREGDEWTVKNVPGESFEDAARAAVEKRGWEFIKNKDDLFFAFESDRFRGVHGDDPNVEGMLKGIIDDVTSGKCDEHRGLYSVYDKEDNDEEWDDED